MNTENGGFIYNVTTQVSWAIHDAWLEWMRNEYIPEVLSKGCFTKYQILRLHEVDESEGATYAIQYYAGSKALYNKHIITDAEVLRQKAYKKWGGQFMSFHSIMQVVQ